MLLSWREGRLEGLLKSNSHLDSHLMGRLKGREISLSDFLDLTVSCVPERGGGQYDLSSILDLHQD